MAQEVNRNPTPKEQLFESKQRMSAHNRILNDVQFQDSINTALLQYQRILTDRPDSEAGVVGLKMKGAAEFVNILMRLTETPTRPSAPASNSLNYKA